MICNRETLLRDRACTWRVCLYRDDRSKAEKIQREIGSTTPKHLRRARASCNHRPQAQPVTSNFSVLIVYIARGADSESYTSVFFLYVISKTQIGCQKQIIFVSIDIVCFYNANNVDIFDQKRYYLFITLCDAEILKPSSNAQR